MNQEETQNIYRPELSNLVDRLGSLKNIETTEQFELQQADTEMLDTLIFGKSEAKSPTGGAVLQLQMAKSQPLKIKALVTANFGTKPNSTVRIQHSKQMRSNQAMRNFGKIVDDPLPTFVPTTPSTIATSLTTVMTGQSDVTDQDYQANLVESKDRFIKYLIKIMSIKNVYMGARLYAAHHFNDPKVFEKFEDMEQELMLAYNHFLSLVSQANLVETNFSQQNTQTQGSQSFNSETNYL